MEPGGVDIPMCTFLRSPEEVLQAARDIALKMWPDAVFVRVVDSFENGIIIYRNPAAQESWDRLGLDASNKSDLIHLLIDLDPPTGMDPLGITIVVDHENDPLTQPFIDAMGDFTSQEK